jgi:hypothetical protein
MQENREGLVLGCGLSVSEHDRATPSPNTTLLEITRTYFGARAHLSTTTKPRIYRVS